MLQAKPEPSERLESEPPEHSNRLELLEGEGERAEEKPRTDAGAKVSKIKKSHLNKGVWKKTVESLGKGKISYEIINALLFLDELENTKIILDDRLFALDLVQSVFVPRGVSPELLKRFSDFIEVS